MGLDVMHTLAFIPYMFDPMWLLYVGPAMILGLVAQAKVKSAYARASRIPASSGLSGAECARRILDSHDIHDVAVDRVKSFLGDHYDPSRRVLRLSPDVFDGRSLASLGIAAHEVGHAIQHATDYAPLKLRGALVPTASFGSNFAIILLIGGMFLQMTGLAIAGLALFGLVVVFQLVNLPVEFNASSRARRILVTTGMITHAEERVVGNVLNAAALTYVAATITAIAQLLYFASIVFGRRH